MKELSKSWSWSSAWFFIYIMYVGGTLYCKTALPTEPVISEITGSVGSIGEPSWLRTPAWSGRQGRQNSRLVTTTVVMRFLRDQEHGGPMALITACSESECGLDDGVSGSWHGPYTWPGPHPNGPDHGVDRIIARIDHDVVRIMAWSGSWRGPRCSPDHCMVGTTRRSDSLAN
jgi:hypothetical protein